MTNEGRLLADYQDAALRVKLPADKCLSEEFLNHMNHL
jgi:hypothetical protein